MNEEAYQQALELAEKHRESIKEFTKCIKRGDVGSDFGSISKQELNALAAAIEKCTPDEIALFIRSLANSVEAYRDSHYNQGYEDGLDDCEESS